MQQAKSLREQIGNVWMPKIGGGNILIYNSSHGTPNKGSNKGKYDGRGDLQGETTLWSGSVGLSEKELEAYLKKLLPHAKNIYVLSDSCGSGAFTYNQKKSPIRKKTPHK